MDDDSYEQLVDALDVLPNGFPRVPSGVEIRLLKKAFTPEEAALAGQMTRIYEPVGSISERAGLPEDRAKELLEDLLPRALVRRSKAGGVAKYRLGPFIVGWYEAMMGRLRHDREFAGLFEQYMKEGGGDRILAPRPGILGVVPARGSLRPELLQPCDDIDAHFARHERFSITDCVCRIEQDLVGGNCSMRLKRCGFNGLPPETPLSEHVLDREDAMALFQQIEDEGHVHLGFYGYTTGAKEPQFVGCCNCCGDCCGVLRGTNDLGLTEGPQRSNYRAAIDLDSCIQCGDCIERCQVSAIAGDSDGMPELDLGRCIGCGVCVIGCPGEAIELVPVPEEEWFDVPSSFEEWEERRLESLKKE